MTPGDAAYFRRAFLELGGTVYKDFKYQLNYDFSHNSVNSDDGYFDEASMSYVGFKPVTIASVVLTRISAWKKPPAPSGSWHVERNSFTRLRTGSNTHENGMGIQVSGTAADMFYGSASLASGHQRRRRQGREAIQRPYRVSTDEQRRRRPALRLERGGT